MERLFFDIDDGMLHRDEIGRWIGSHQALRREAMRVLGRRLAIEGEDGNGYVFVIRVRNAADTTVLTLRAVCQFDDRIEVTWRRAD